jgi:hypothetical protein
MKASVQVALIVFGAVLATMPQVIVGVVAANTLYARAIAARESGAPGLDDAAVARLAEPDWMSAASMALGGVMIAVAIAGTRKRGAVSP